MKSIIDYLSKRIKDNKYEMYNINDPIQAFIAGFTVYANTYEGFDLVKARKGILNDKFYLLSTNSGHSLLGLTNGMTEEVFEYLPYRVDRIEESDDVIILSTKIYKNKDIYYIRGFVYEDYKDEIKIVNIPMEVNNKKFKCTKVQKLGDYILLEDKDDNKYLFHIDNMNFILNITDYIKEKGKTYKMNNPLLTISYVVDNIVAMSFYDALSKDSPEYISFNQTRWEGVSKEDFDRMQQDVASQMEESLFIEKYKDIDPYLVIRNIKDEDIHKLNDRQKLLKRKYDTLQSKIVNKDKILIYFDLSKGTVLNEFIDCSHISSFKHDYVIISEDTLDEDLDVDNIDFSNKGDKGQKLFIAPLVGEARFGYKSSIGISNKTQIKQFLKGSDLICTIYPDYSGEETVEHQYEFFTIEDNKKVTDTFTSDSIPKSINLNEDTGVITLEYQGRAIKQTVYFYNSGAEDIVVSKIDIKFDTDMDPVEVAKKWKKHLSTLENEDFDTIIHHINLLIQNKELFNSDNNEIHFTSHKCDDVVSRHIHDVAIDKGRMVVHFNTDDSIDYFLRIRRT